MRLSGCAGKTLGRPAAVRRWTKPSPRRTSGASNGRLVFAGAMIDAVEAELGSASDDRADCSWGLRGGGRRGGGCVRRLRRHARVAGASPGDRARADPAFSRRCRALALRARALAEILPMRRAHRAVHRALWPILAFAIAAASLMALLSRPPPDAAAPPPAKDA